MPKPGNRQVKIDQRPSGRRNPQSALTIEGRKEPKAVERVEFLNLKAAWRVNKIQLVDPYGWHQLTLPEIDHIREKLAIFESMTWSEIFVRDKKRNHAIPVHDFRCEQARRWMKRNMADQPELWTIRFTGPERVWGIFSEGAYQIVFWDPEHRIYPTQL
jgi:hypothetical protein